MDDNKVWVQDGITLPVLLEKIEQIRADSSYIQDALRELSTVKSEGPGDIGAAGKAQAIADVIKSREETNRKILSLYEKMYDDIQHREDTKT